MTMQPIRTSPNCQPRWTRIVSNFQGKNVQALRFLTTRTSLMPAIPFASRTLQAFRRANINTMLEIEKLDKQELFASTGDLRNRNAAKHNKTNLVFQHDSVTEKMLAISRHLSETTQKSAITLETLVSSSANVEGTNDELQNTAGNILHSKRLLKKYGRRECTDKILVFFAFTLFVACVLYIVHKRLF